MKATTLEYRFRFALYALIFVVGFWPTFAPLAGLPTGLSWLGLPAKSTWLILSADLAQAGWLGFQAATSLLLVLAIVFTALGAVLRVWGSAYVGTGVVQSPVMQGQALLADGPYRHSRNPLYLGTLLHTVGIALLMSPAGAVFAIAAIWILQVRLTLAEEPFLAARFGEAYSTYEARVPRFLPSLRPLVPAAGQRPAWLSALVGEIYFVGVVVTLAGFGWDFNAFPLLKGILISLGLSLMLRAFLPRTKAEPISVAA